MNIMSLCRRLAPQRLQLGPVGLVRHCPECCRATIECRRRIDTNRSPQRRTLLTAVTNSPTLLTKYPEQRQPPPTVLPGLVDAAISWASESHTIADPPSHAIILAHKALIPQGRNQLLDALGQSTRLGGLNALVGVVDSVGEGAKGVSVLLASRSEDVSIDTLEGVQNEVLRVGKWHAKDVETEDTTSFEDILASIRGGAHVSAATPASGVRFSGTDSVFVVGEMEAVQTQASLLNEKFPSADIVSSPGFVELTEDGSYFGTDSNDQFTFYYVDSQWSRDTLVKCCIVQSSSKRQQGVSLSNRRTQRILAIGRTHTHNNKVCLRHSFANLRFSGNLILEIDNKPAMPYLLSLLPPQTEEDKLNPIPLVAKLPSSNSVNSLYLNVLGGSTSRGGIALDPLVASGRLSLGAKVEFGQLRKAYLASVNRPQQRVHIQFECVSPISRRWEPENEKWGKYKRIEEGFEKQQRYKNHPELTYNKRLEYQGLQKGLFSAGSEGGFLVGAAGVVPWLIRTQGSRLVQQLTPHESGQRRTPLSTKPTHRISVQRHQSLVDNKAQVREFLKSRQLILSKRAIRVDQQSAPFPPWTTIPYLRPMTRYELTKEQKQVQTERRILREQYKSQQRMWRAKEKLKQLAQFRNKKFQRPEKPVLPPERRNYHGLTFGDLPPYLQRLFEDNPIWNKSIPRLKIPKDRRIVRIQRENRLRMLPKYIQKLVARDPITRKLIWDGDLSHLKWFGRGEIYGRRRFGFRARAGWRTFRSGWFRRLDHRPGGVTVNPMRLRSGQRRTMEVMRKPKIHKLMEDVGAKGKRV